MTLTEPTTDSLTLPSLTASITTALVRALNRQGLHAAGLFDYSPDHCEVRILIDYEGGPDLLGLTISADADSLGRPARVMVGWNRGESRIVRWGDGMEALADFDEIARAIRRDMQS